MSPAVAALVGVVVGIVANHFVRHLGRVVSEPSGWEMNLHREGELRSYSFGLDLFNGRDMPTGLRNLTVVLICKDGELVSKPEDRATRSVHKIGSFTGTRSRITFEEMSVINLPPRQWVHKEFQGTFVMKEGVTISEWQRVELVGEWPSRLRSTFKKKVAER